LEFATASCGNCRRFYKQYFKLGEIIDASSTLFSAHASYNRGILILYDGIGGEVSNLDISYTFESDTNSVDNIEATLTYKDLQSGKVKIFEDYPVPITGVLGIANLFSPVSLLLDKGINKLKGKIGGYLKNNDYFDYEIILEGDTKGKRLVAEIRFKIIATVEYTECVTVLSPFSDGEKCGSGASGM